MALAGVGVLEASCFICAQSLIARRSLAHVSFTGQYVKLNLPASGQSGNEEMQNQLVGK